MIIKNAIPILEVDTDQRALIMPNAQEKCVLPERAAFAFLGGEVDAFAAANKDKCTVAGEFVTITKTFPVYTMIYEGVELCFCQAPLGSAAAVMLLDFLIAAGVKKIAAAGSCGTLTNAAENEFFVPTEALRDEGTSYKYLPPSRTVCADMDAVKAIERALERNGVSYRECKAWTTDGFFRETKAMLDYRIQEGCEVVDMELAGLLACAKFRGVKFAQMLFTADTLQAEDGKHDPRSWGYGSFSPAMMLCLEAAKEL